MISVEVFNKRYETDAIEKETMKNITKIIEEKAKIRDVNEITELVKSDIQPDIAKEEIEEEKIR